MVRAQFQGTHDQHMQVLMRDYVLLNLREYVQAATTVTGDSALVFGRLMNLHVALNAFFDHAVQGNGGQAAALCQQSPCAVVNRELSHGVRHYLTDRGHHVTSHSARRVREITAGDHRETESLFRFQVQLMGGEVDVNEVIAGTLVIILQEAGNRGWVTAEQSQEVEEQVKQVWPRWGRETPSCPVPPIPDRKA